MSRLLVTLILIAVVVIGGLFLLAGIDAEKPQTRIEQAVALDNLSK